MSATRMTTDVTPVLGFLRCRTPQSWVDTATDNLTVLLNDHANCERKAASTALSLMQRYATDLKLVNKMSRLAREELRHFEQVLALMKKLGISVKNVSASQYASGLHEHIRKTEPQRLVDTLIVGAIIEARSCERFFSLVPVIDEPIAEFYAGLLRSESRHFMDYLGLARAAGQEQQVNQRLDLFLDIEKQLICQTDHQFRFHSGVPVH